MCVRAKQQVKQDHDLKYFFQFYEELFQEVSSYKPDLRCVDHANILLVGAVGAGKSSTVNSIASTIKRKVHTLAYSVNNAANETVTKKVGIIASYHIKPDIMMWWFTFLLVKNQKEIQIFYNNSFRIFTSLVL